MTLKSYLLSMSIATLICWSVFVFIINTINPFTTNYLGFILFYLALFFALSGTILLIGFFLRFIIFRQKLAFYLVKVAFRQSFLLALFLCVLLFFFSQALVNWLNLVLLLTVFIILEVFFASFKIKNTN
jgi:hypothetical protein